MSEIADFFVAGGTLRPWTKSYVTRPADRELLEQARAGEFCYVLTPRQMGKSSLMVRMGQRLRQLGHKTVMIDLTGIGAKEATADAWYQGLLARLKTGLRLAIDIESWWTERHKMSLPQRFIEFLHDVVLKQVSEPVTIFVDEIDSTLGLNFKDDFFAAIRAIYNERARDSSYHRLTFVLLGVATPTGLIADPERTPFNVGRRIDLHEFSRADAQVLASGLDRYYPGQGAAILDRILYWTSGHPYLTQKLCLAVVKSQVTEWTEARVDNLVKANFFTDEARKDTNLTSIQDSIQEMPADERRQALQLYQNVLAGNGVASDENSSVQNHLALYGLVRATSGHLQVRNKVYQHVFDANWAKANMPANRERGLAILASLISLLLVGLTVYLVLNSQTPPEIQAQVCKDNFAKTTSPAVRIDALACLFDLGPGYDEDARELFYSLSSTDQKYLFLLDDPQAVGTQLISAVKGIYVTLDQMEGHHDQAILEAILKALEDSGQSEAENLVEEIRYWKQGRDQADQQQYQQSVNSYTMAIDRNPNDNHPVVHYDRAMAYLELQQYDKALADLERTVIIAKLAPPTPTQTPAQPSPTPTPTSTPLPTNTPESIATPTATSSQTPSVEINTPANNAEPSFSTPVLPPVVTTQPVTVTPKLTLSPNITLSLRFINSDRVIETVGETIRQNENLQDYIRKGPDAYPQLSALIIPSRNTPSPRPGLTPGVITARSRRGSSGPGT